MLDGDDFDCVFVARWIELLSVLIWVFFFSGLGSLQLYGGYVLEFGRLWNIFWSFILNQEMRDPNEIRFYVYLFIKIAKKERINKI